MGRQADDEVLLVQDSSDESEKDVSVGDYDYDDQFIDDSEMIELMKGDRRKPKYEGFFINKVDAPVAE